MAPKDSSRGYLWVAGIAVLLAVGLAALWFGRGSLDAAADAEALGRRWAEAPGAWGPPIVSADTVRLAARESAARRPEGESGLVIPHAEIVVDAPRPVHGPGARASNPFLIFTNDGDAAAFLRKATTGPLASTPGEYRTAIDRAGPVRIVRLDGAGRMRRIEVVQPVFITVNIAAGR